MSNDTVTSEKSNGKGSSPLTSSVPGSRAKTCRLPASGQESRGRERDSGLRSSDAFAIYDPDSSFWRTCQASFPWGSDEYSGTWPRAGMTRNGIASLRQPLVPLTAVTGSSLWRSPTAYDWKNTGHSEQVYLGDQVRPSQVVNPKKAQTMWRTPAAREPGWKYIEIVDKDGNPPTHPNQRFYDKATGRVVQQGLTQQVERWPIKGVSLEKAQATEEGAGGALNPTWVEWLMGFPAEWTALDA